MRKSKLFEPIKIGTMELKNRIWFLPVTTNYHYRGEITSRTRSFYLERALGGAGLITFGFMPPVNYEGSELMGEAIHSDNHVGPLREFTREIHHAGAKVLAQLCLRHQWRGSEGAPLEYVAPTAGIVTGPGIMPPRELTVAEIQQIVEQFGDAARRAQEAEFDAVEFHCGLGYLINRFISSATNKRTDQYGGSLENRCRLILEILENARRKVGQDFPMVCRLSAEEYVPEGHHLKESQQVARLMVKAGAAAINVQAGWLESPQPLIQSSVPQGAYVFLAEGIKKVVPVPIVAGYRINDPVLAERILEEGRADLIGMCRALVADPYLPNKARESRFDEIRPCIACCHCLDVILEGNPMVCTVNPWAGREREYQLKPAPQAKKVVVVGGGPAGMQAAIVAGQRGHQVTLFEEDDELGGQMISASVPPHKTEIETFNKYLIGETRRARVEVRLSTRADPGLILGMKPDAVFLATGAVPAIPEVRGVHGKNAVDPVSVLTGKAEIGQQVVVVGGGLVGCETAEFLATRGRKVTITSRQKRIGHDYGASTRWVVRKRLEQAGVVMKPRMLPVEITDKGVLYQQDGQQVFLEADTVVVAGGMHADKGLARALEGKLDKLYAIGDCVTPGRITEATDSAVRTVLDL